MSMIRALPIAACAAAALLASLAAATAASSPVITWHRTITCPFLADGSLTIDVPPARNAMPKIDFDYSSKATLFSFRDNNLFLVAMDESESSRLRVVVSAQRNRKSGSYDGQIFVDMGGNQLMHYNGPVHCRVG
jgi:hypothetical protein